MKKYLFLICLLACAVITRAQISQLSDSVFVHRNEQGAIRFARFKPNPSGTILQPELFLKTLLKTSTADQFKLVHERTDKQGYAHTLYQQYYQGVKVEYATYATHARNGKIETVNGNFEKINIPSVMPAVNEAGALIAALQAVNAKKYRWEDANWEKFIRKNRNDAGATYYPKGELLIMKDPVQGTKLFHLAWKFTIATAEPTNEFAVYVDAGSGKIIKKASTLQDANIPIQGQTMYSGLLGLTGDSFSGGIRLQETRNGVQIQTLNNNGSDFVNNSQQWTAANWTDFTRDQAALDAHWGAEVVLDYWHYVHNRSGLDDAGMPLVSYVHATQNAGNAAWNPTDHTISYGDGSSDGSVGPIVTLDFCAHETGHGITQFTAGLAYGYSETGALNEGISDIWGAVIEFHGAPTKRTWWMGEDMFAGANNVRSLSNPYESGEGAGPNTYHGDFWDYNNEPHQNSTVLGHWFFLLTQGGDGWNNGHTSHAAANDGYHWQVAGISIDDAASIVYGALVNHDLVSDANYADARNAMIASATRLFGDNSCQVIAVKNAWHAVGVGDGDDIMITSNSTGSLCPTQTFALSSLTGVGSTITWSAPVTGMVTPTSGSGPTFTVSQVGTSSGQTTVSADYNRCGVNYTLVKLITVGNTSVQGGTYTSNGSAYGLVESTDLDFSNTVCYTSARTTTDVSLNLAGANTVVWEKTYSSPAVLTWGQSGNGISITFRGVGQQAMFKVTATNNCGVMVKYFGFQSVSCANLTARESVNEDNNLAGKNILLAPNPASRTISISVKGGFQSAGNDIISEVSIFDAMGRLMKRQRFNNANVVTMDVSDLLTGIYFVDIVNGTNHTRKNLVINR